MAMQETEYIWHKGSFVKWHEAQVHVLTHALHYGSAVFEGIRAYETPQGAAIFRLKEHIARLFYSASALRMMIPHTEEEVCQATIDLVAKNNLAACYIRPLAYYDYGVMGLNPRNAPTALSIACWPWGAYLPHDMVDLKTSSYIRIHPQSTKADAKISGHYVNSILSVLELQGTHYHESLLCDVDGNLMEGPGENLFLVSQGTLYTPALGGILAGITRDTIMTLAKDSGMTVVEKTLNHKDLFAADEAFYTGTAAEVTPIRSVDDRTIGGGTIGPVTQMIKQRYAELVRGQHDQYRSFLSYVHQ
jgi:branched-chain amino acid aminotransferase